MAPLRNPRHERFAQERAKGKTATEAHVVAGFKRNDSNAAKLNARPEIRDRITEITGAGAKRSEITLQGLLDEAAEIQRLAIEAGQFSATIAALKLRAVLFGPLRAAT